MCLAAIQPVEELLDFVQDFRFMAGLRECPVVGLLEARKPRPRLGRIRNQAAANQNEP